MPDPAKNPDLHGNVPESSSTALLLVDVLNALRFDGSEAFVPRAMAVGERILALKNRARSHGIPVIYVNDNADRWRSDLPHIIADCTRNDAPGRALTRLLVPSSNDYVVLKPKHSGFYSTALDTVLTYLRARRLILTGLTTERCLLFTANDAFLRDYELFVPRDCTAAIDDGDHSAAKRSHGVERAPWPKHQLEPDSPGLRSNACRPRTETPFFPGFTPTRASVAWAETFIS